MAKQTEKPATPQEIWNILREVSISQKETDRRLKETEHILKESGKETDRRMQETDRRLKETEHILKESGKETDRIMQETGRKMKETDRRIKELHYLFTGHWGKLMETLVEGELVKLLKQKNIQVERTYSNVKGEYKGDRWEIDLVAANGNEVVVVEVKTTLKLNDVKNFQKQLNVFTEFASEYKGKKVYGAVAFLKANSSADVFAEKAGLFVIRATGSSASIINKKNFKPKIFS